MKPKVFSALSFMMFLEYFIWGAWYVTMGIYMSEFLASSGTQIGAAYSSLALATMISPFFVGMVADRFFAAQKIVAFLHLGGAVLLFLATRVEGNGGFYWIILLYSLLYMPTIALTNSIAFGQMTDAGKQFPWIRVFGTLGWIVAGLMIGILGIERTPFTFQMAAVASLLLGLFSFLLPHTPPKGKDAAGSVAQALGTEGLVLLRNRPYLVFFIAAILICIPLSFYYGFANVFLNDLGMTNAASKMTLGQASEAILILAIPFLFNRIGVKNMLLLGMGAWLLRYVCFAYGDLETGLWMLYAGIILHGVCYDFFFVTGFIYTEEKAGPRIKSAAQGLFTFATYGVGMVIGTRLSGITTDLFTKDGSMQWTAIWLVPAGIAGVVMLVFFFTFHEKRRVESI